MEFNISSENLNVLWTRWSEYEIVEKDGQKGKELYIQPAPRAEKLTYNCAEQSEKLVADALELGRFLSDAAHCETEKHTACITFAAHYGLLGIHADDDSEQPYAEKLDLFEEEFLRLYRHFFATRETTGEMRPPALTGSLSFRLTGGSTPQLVWNAPNLLTVLHVAYAAALTEQVPALRVCRNCGRIYYNPHVKSEFCSVRCRNVFNVRAYRAAQKTAKEALQKQIVKEFQKKI